MVPTLYQEKTFSVKGVSSISDIRLRFHVLQDINLGDAIVPSNLEAFNSPGSQ